VVLKIKKTEIARDIETDLQVLNVIAQNAGKISKQLALQLSEVEGFLSRILESLISFQKAEMRSSYRRTWQHSLRFASLPFTGILQPNILTIITLIRIYQSVQEISEMGIDTKNRDNLLKSYEANFSRGLFHGDPNPSNRS
jgi:predicted unusual protein kinase regulating ubiquinone biosynthesis (AarF/ABC1/UbiB family)